MRPLSMREAPPTGGYGGSFLRLWVAPETGNARLPTVWDRVTD